MIYKPCLRCCWLVRWLDKDGCGVVGTTTWPRPVQRVTRPPGGGGDLLIAELLPSIAHSVVLNVPICADVAFIHIIYVHYILPIEYNID